MSKGIKNNPATGRAEQHPCRRLLTAAVTVAGPLCIIMPASAALNCTTQPSCTELGYSKTNEANCESYVLCPFDTSYKACVKYSTSEADCSGYTLTSCPANADCSECKSGDTIKYKINSCKSGYTLNGNICEVNACTDYPLDSCPTGATSCSECQNGSTTKYKVNGCVEGYTLDSGSCRESTCYDYQDINDRNKRALYTEDELEGRFCKTQYVFKSGENEIECYANCRLCEGFGYYPPKTLDEVCQEYRVSCVVLPEDVYAGNTAANANGYEYGHCWKTEEPMLIENADEPICAGLPYATEWCVFSY